jgi:probable F420-dependent oxidoreductase
MAPDSLHLDWFSLSAFIAARTSRLRMRTNIFVLTTMPPLLTAKLASTIDYLSHGRLELGLGTGWLKEEFEALGVPWEARGRRMDEYIRVLRTVWTEHAPSFDGEFVQFGEIHMEPKPVQDPLPLYLTASKNGMLPRVAKLGDGWLVPPEVTGNLDDFKTRRDELRRLLVEEGRDAERFPMLLPIHVSFSAKGVRSSDNMHVYPPDPDLLLELLAVWGSEGITHVDLSFRGYDLELSKIMERMEFLGREVAAHA